MNEEKFKIILDTIQRKSENGESTLELHFPDECLSKNQFQQLQIALESNTSMHHLTLTNLTDSIEEDMHLLGGLIASLISKKKSLHKLRLNFCWLLPKEVALIAQVLPDSALLVLELVSCNINYIGASVIAAALPKTCIVNLNLSHNPIQNKGAQAIFASLGDSALQELNIEDCQLSDTFYPASWSMATQEGHIDLETVFKGLDQSKLVILDISDNCIAEEGAQYFAQVLIDSQIVKLNLSECQIGSDGLKAIIDVLPKTLLGNLNVSKNGIASVAASLLLRMLSESQIYALDLSENDLNFDDEKIDSAFKQNIINVLKLPQLRVLNLSRTYIQYNILEILNSGLSETSGILSLDLSNTRFSPTFISDPIQQQTVTEKIKKTKLHTLKLIEVEGEDLKLSAEHIMAILNNALSENQNKIKEKTSSFEVRLSEIHKRGQVCLESMKSAASIKIDEKGRQEDMELEAISKASQALFYKTKLLFYFWQILYFDEEKRMRKENELQSILWQCLGNMVTHAKRTLFSIPYVWILEDIDEKRYTRLQRAIFAFKEDRDDMFQIKKLFGKSITAHIAGGPLLHTSLHAAAQQGKSKVLLTLFCDKHKTKRKKVDAFQIINQQDKHGHTVLHLAIKENLPESSILLLIAYGAKVDIRNNTGQTPKGMADPQLRRAIEADAKKRSENDAQKLLANIKNENTIIKFENDYLKEKFAELQKEFDTFKTSAQGKSLLESDRDFLQKRQFRCINGFELFSSMKNQTPMQTLPKESKENVIYLHHV